MPARNAERTLADALASIRAQTVAVAEIVVVDDGSSDATAAIARAAGATVVEGPRMGPGAARNAGIRAAAQPWIAFLDADDRWDPEKTARQLAALNEVPEVGFSATDVRAARDGKPVRASWFAAEPAYRRVARGALPGGAVLAARGGLLEALGRNNFLVTSSVMVRRELAAAGVLFDETLLQTPGCFVPEDWEWYLRVLGQTDAVIVEAPLVEYRLSAASLSADGPAAIVRRDRTRAARPRRRRPLSPQPPSTPSPPRKRSGSLRRARSSPACSTSRAHAMRSAARCVRASR